MYRRWRVDGALFAVSVVVLALSMLVARGDEVPAWEETVFRWVNGLPDFLYPIVWPLMQYGTFITIPIVFVLGLLVKRWRFAIVSLVVGVGIYYLAKAVKLVVDRGRPGAELVGDLELRGVGRFGHGFPSGHAAVSAALAVIASAYLPPLWGRLSIALAVIVSFGRVYVGAHLPLDVIGGAALGVAVAAAVNLIIGVPTNVKAPAPRTTAESRNREGTTTG
ncbi:MAG TPA: phosphatase PAP2 family protein [Actinomycetota bacterium]|nr:phosphatase PAP2 family protein [Actinomycetota bacterium]